MHNDVKAITNVARIYCFNEEEQASQKGVIEAARRIRHNGKALLLRDNFLLPVTNIEPAGPVHLKLTDEDGCHELRASDSWTIGYDDGRNSELKMYLCDDRLAEGGLDRDFWAGRTRNGQHVIQAQTHSALYVTTKFSGKLYQKAGVMDGDIEKLRRYVHDSRLVYLQPETSMLLVSKLVGIDFSLHMGSALVGMEGELYKVS